MSQRLKKFRYGGRCGRRDRNEKSAQVERERQKARERGGLKCQVTWTLVLFCQWESIV